MTLYLMNNGALVHKCMATDRKEYYHSAYQVDKNKIICYITITDKYKCNIEVPSLFYFDIVKEGLGVSTNSKNKGFWLGAEFYCVDTDTLNYNLKSIIEI